MNAIDSENIDITSEFLQSINYSAEKVAALNNLSNEIKNSAVE